MSRTVACVISFRVACPAAPATHPPLSSPFLSSESLSVTLAFGYAAANIRNRKELFALLFAVFALSCEQARVCFERITWSAGGAREYSFEKACCIRHATSLPIIWTLAHPRVTGVHVVETRDCIQVGSFLTAHDVCCASSSSGPYMGLVPEYLEAQPSSALRKVPC